MQNAMEILESRTFNSAAHFVVGVFDQPDALLETWHHRGVNTAVYSPRNTDPEMYAWDSAAFGAGLKIIRQPSSNLHHDAQLSGLTAWMQPDEPDYKDLPAQTLADNYQRMQHEKSTLPVLCNFAGPDLLNPYYALHRPYAAYIQQSTWVASDTYPYAWGQPQWIDRSRTVGGARDANPLNILGRLTPGVATQKLIQMSGGKRALAFVETSWQDLADFGQGPGCYPTPAQVRGETWDAICNGATGIVYFPQRVGKNVFADDNTTPAVAQEITVQNALISKYDKWLMAPVCSKPVKQFKSDLVEYITHKIGKHRVTFALNCSSIPVTDGGATFAPWGVKVFKK